MSRDNVTPFRRPPKRPVAPQQSGGFGFKTHRGKAVLAHLLTLATFALNLVFTTAPLSFIGLAVAIAAFLFVYSNRGAAMPWANTHHEHALRTLIIGYALITLASVLVLVTPILRPVSLWAQIAVSLWGGVRAAIVLVLAMLRRPVPHPHGWLV